MTFSFLLFSFLKQKDYNISSSFLKKYSFTKEMLGNVKEKGLEREEMPQQCYNWRLLQGKQRDKGSKDLCTFGVGAWVLWIW